jgi:hypothetical protein
MSIERAFCTNKLHIPAFRAYGLPDKLIWLDGRGPETLDRCLSTFRGRPGRLLVAPDLTALGSARRDIAAVMARLERAKIRVLDIIHPRTRRSLKCSSGRPMPSARPGSWTAAQPAPR